MTDEARILHQINAMVDAICNKDLDTLRTIYSSDIVSFDVQPPLQHVGVDAKLKNWVEAFAMFETIEYDTRDLSVTVGEDLAFGHGFFRMSGTLTGGASTPGMWVRWTGCFQNLDDTWQIVHDQVSVPLDFATGRGVVDLAP